MTRRFLDDIRSDIVTLMPDNNIGAITPAITRGILTDMVDSTVQDEGAISANAPTLGIATTDSFTQLTTPYAQNAGGDGDFITPDQINGEITTSSTAGFTYSLIGSIAFEGSANDPFEFVILEDGSPVGFITRETGEGNNDPVSSYVRTLIDAAPADAVYSIGVRTPEGNNTIDILDIELVAIIQPTNNP